MHFYPKYGGLVVIIYSQTFLSGNFNKHLFVIDYFDDVTDYLISC